MVGRKTRSQEWTEQQMMNLTPAAPASSPPPAEYIAVGDLLQILNNATALKEHIAKIAAAHAKNKKDFEAAKLRIEAEHADHLATQDREHADKLAEASKKFAADRESFAADRKAAWAEIEAARQQVAADRKVVDELKADLNRRLQRVREVATETA